MKKRPNNPRVPIVREAIGKIVEMLSHRQIRVTQRGVQAYVRHNPKTLKPDLVNIPYLPDDASDELIQATQGFLDHEVAHLLFTDFEWMHKAGQRGKEFHSLTNIIEDTFIERMMAKRFQGSGYNLGSIRNFLIEEILEPEIRKLPPNASEADWLQILIMPVFRAYAGHEQFKDFMAPYWEHIKNFTNRLGPDMESLVQSVSCTEDSMKLAEEVRRRVKPPKLAAPPGMEGEPSDEEDDTDGDGEEEAAPSKEPGKGKEKPGEEKPDDKGDDSEEEEKKPSAKPKEEKGTKPEKGDEEEKKKKEEKAKPKPDPTKTDEEGDNGGDGEGDDSEEESDGGSQGGTDDPKDEEEEGAGGTGDKGDDSEEESESADGESDSGGDSSSAEEEEGEADDADGSSASSSPPGDGDSDPQHQDKDDSVSELVEEEKTQAEESDNRDRGSACSDIPYTGEDPEGEDDELSEVLTRLDEDFDDLASRAITQGAATESKNAEYLIWSTDFDSVELIPVPKNFQSDANCKKMYGEMIDKVDHMIGPMQKDIERAIAARSAAIWTPGHRSGKLHGGSLHKVTMQRDDVFRRKHENRTKDVAVELVVDASGSMYGKIATAAYAAYGLSGVLDRLQIPNEVVSFSTSSMPADAATQMQKDLLALRAAGSKRNSYSRNEPLNIAIIKKMDERMTPATRERFCTLGHFYREGLRNNVDGESIQVAHRRLMRHKAARKVMIVLSDGMPHGYGVLEEIDDHLGVAVKGIEASGVDVVGIGIQDDSVKKYYRKHVVLDSIDDLPAIVMGQLKQLLMPKF